MKVEQLYTDCLAEAAYYIESNGEAAIIDPLREVQQYIDMANANGVKIKYIFETHFHADFVSGHVDLAEKTGAQIVFGPTAKTDFDSIIATDEQVFTVGDLSIKVLHTPGHTMESSTFLLKDEDGKDYCIFSGDTLFIGDVGRPDLAIKSDVTKEDLAGMLFDSLRTKIMTLADDVIVYPAHGAGSACGKNMSSETFATLGNQKENNYALQDLSKAEFVKEVTTGIMPPPSYFPKAAMLNKTGYKSIDDVVSKAGNALKPEEVLKLQADGALVLDTRSKEDFHDGFVKGSIFIGIDGSFAPWVGTVIKDNAQPIIIVADQDRVEEITIRLSRVGYDNTIGYLDGGYQAWQEASLPVDKIESIAADELSEILKENKINLIDARKPSEFDAEHSCTATNRPLDFISTEIESYNSSQKYYVHCRTGYRSLIYTSILKQSGITDVVDIEGGFVAMQEADISMSEFQCPSGN